MPAPVTAMVNSSATEARAASCKVRAAASPSATVCAAGVNDGFSGSLSPMVRVTLWLPPGGGSALMAPGAAEAAVSMVTVRASAGSFRSSSTAVRVTARSSPAVLKAKARAEGLRAKSPSVAAPLKDRPAKTLAAPGGRPPARLRVRVTLWLPPSLMAVRSAAMPKVTGSEGAMAAVAAAISTPLPWPPPLAGADTAMRAVRVSVPSFSASSAMAMATVCGIPSAKDSMPLVAPVTSAAAATPLAGPAPLKSSRQFTRAGLPAGGVGPSIVTVNSALPPSAAAAAGPEMLKR